MCGRYSLAKRNTDYVARLLEADNLARDVVKPSYNVAPTQMVAGAVERKGKRELVALKWGLIPSWAKDPKIGSKLINARAETVGEKPAFRAAFQRRRCLIPADGYYEWEQTPSGKQPHYLTPKQDELLTMAGLYEIWKDAEGMPWWTCTILTTDAPDELGHIHNRTPMTILPQDWEAWLSPDFDDPHSLLHPAVSGQLDDLLVSTKVNSVRNNGPELVEPVGASS